MARTLNVADQEAVTRQDTFRVNPGDVAEGRNARMIEAPGYEENVKNRAISIAKHGQLEPVGVMQKPDRTLVMAYGYTRRDAILLLREGFDAIDPDSGEKTHFHNPNATLWIKIEKMTEDEAFLRGISENVQRKDTTDLQEALAQSELRTTLGWTDARIARFYGYKNQNRVSALSKLLSLPDDVQTRVHEGKLALYTALETLDLDPETRATILDGATDDTGKVQGSVLRELLRKHYEAGPAEGIPAAGDEEDGRGAEGVEGGDGEDPKVKKHLPRGRKDLERVLAEKTDEAATGYKLTAASAELLDVLILWMKGRRTDEYLTEKLNEYTR